MTKRWYGAGLVLVVLGVAPLARAVEWTGKVPTDRERGQELYDRHCTACHGVRAKGDGPLAAALTTAVPDLSTGLDASRMEDMVRMVLRGKGVMPSFEQSFRDLRPHDDDWKRFPRAVLDYMDDVARNGPSKSKVAPVMVSEEDEEEGAEAQAPGE